VPIEIGGWLWKADPWGRTFRKRFFQLKPVAGALIYAVDDSPHELANPRGASTRAIRSIDAMRWVVWCRRATDRRRAAATTRATGRGTLLLLGLLRRFLDTARGSLSLALWHRATVRSAARRRRPPSQQCSPPPVRRAP
jgi:hypothetical protein